MTHVALVTKNDRTGDVSIREGVLLGETVTEVERLMKDAPADCRRWAVIAPTRAEALRVADVWVRQAQPRVPRPDVPEQPAWLPPPPCATRSESEATRRLGYVVENSVIRREEPPTQDSWLPPGNAAAAPDATITTADRRADIATKMMAALICEPQWSGENQMLVGRINDDDSPTKIQDQFAFAAVALADALIRALEVKS